MVHHRIDTPRLGLDDYVDAFESAQAQEGVGDYVDLAPFLPEPSHPLYRAVLHELVRIDLEYHWERGRPRRLADYEHTFPELLQDRDRLPGLAFEEYRLRL